MYRSTLLEKPSVTQDHNTRVTENSVPHLDREAQSLVLTDFSDHSTWMMEFSVTLVFWSYVTLGFFNSAGREQMSSNICFSIQQKLFFWRKRRKLKND
jgi:hypothetical protein